MLSGNSVDINRNRCESYHPIDLNPLILISKLCSPLTQIILNIPHTIGDDISSHFRPERLISYFETVTSWF